jgi:hypothetical protein
MRYQDSVNVVSTMNREGQQDGASASAPYCKGDQDGASAPAQHPNSPRPYAVEMWYQRAMNRVWDQDSANTPTIYRVGNQDGASAPAPHPSSPPPYARGMLHLINGGITVHVLGGEG